MLAVLMRTRALRRRLTQEDKQYRLQLEARKRAKQQPIMDLCRTCLSVSDLNPIFDPGSEERITKDLELTTGIVIKPNDGYPQKICNNCLLALNEALQFRKRSIKAHKALLNQKVPNLKPKPKAKTKIKTEVIEDQDYGDGFGDDHWNGDDGKVEVEVIVKKKQEKKKDRELKCKQCKKEFKTFRACQAHVRQHDFFVVCEECGKKCRNDYVLTSHKRAKHNMEKIHKCQHCDYESANREALVIHLRRHTGEKPYVCDSCGASFHRRSNLVQHIAIHLPEKNFKCQYCGKTFFSKKFVNSHIFKTHQEKRYLYKCIECHNQFRTTDSVRKHMLRAHGITKEQQGPVFRVPRMKS